MSATFMVFDVLQNILVSSVGERDYSIRCVSLFSFCWDCLFACNFSSPSKTAALAQDTTYIWKELAQNACLVSTPGGRWKGGLQEVQEVDLPAASTAWEGVIASFLLSFLSVPARLSKDKAMVQITGSSDKVAQAWPHETMRWVAFCCNDWGYHSSIFMWYTRAWRRKQSWLLYC